MTDRIPTILYRHFNRAGDLLYVGISLRPFRRTKEHRGDKDWWPEVATTTYEEFPSRGDRHPHRVTAAQSRTPSENGVRVESPLVGVAAPVADIEVLAVRTCPVQADCLTEAVTNGDPYGFRAGLTPDQIADMIAKRTGGDTAKVCEMCGGSFTVGAFAGIRRYCGATCASEAQAESKRAYQRRVRGTAA